MTARSAVSLVALLAACAARSPGVDADAPPPRHADLVLQGAVVVTMNPAQPTAEAVADPGTDLKTLLR